jgi:uncharacterized protein YbjT (DUF2867 family)
VSTTAAWGSTRVHSLMDDRAGEHNCRLDTWDRTASIGLGVTIIECREVAVLGSTGFVGSAVTSYLRQRGVHVRTLRAPRLGEWHAQTAFDAPPPPDAYSMIIESLQAKLEGVDAVVNCAGLSTATSGATGRLVAANGLLPHLLARACDSLGVERLVHVSSAAVQGRKATLDATAEYDPVSPYAVSKILGERWLLEVRPQGIVYRPPGVHWADRQVTGSLVRFARSPFAYMPTGPAGPAPQALLPNVASAIAFLCLCSSAPPSIVHHPWEGLSALDLIASLRGGPPHFMPRKLTEWAISLARSMGRISPRSAALSRRLEVLWHGQGITKSWLEANGWEAPIPASAWADLSPSSNNKHL